MAEVRALLAAALREWIDDLKAVIVDALDSVRLYVRQSDTRVWKACWAGERPYEENTCRDRLLDILGGYVPQAIALMPEAKRADIVAIYSGHGIPMEFEGQRRLGRILGSARGAIRQGLARRRARNLCGFVVWLRTGEKIPKHPDGVRAPSNSEELRHMLADRLDPGERARIDVIVIDLSKPPSAR